MIFPGHSPVLFFNFVVFEKQSDSIEGGLGEVGDVGGVLNHGVDQGHVVGEPTL